MTKLYAAVMFLAALVLELRVFAREPGKNATDLFFDHWPTHLAAFLLSLVALAALAEPKKPN